MRENVLTKKKLGEKFLFVTTKTFDVRYALYSLAVQAMRDPSKRFRLFNLLSKKQLLLRSLKKLSKGRGRHARGVDGVRPIDWEANPEARIQFLRRKLIEGSYRSAQLRPASVVNAYTGKARTVGIASVEDRVLANALSQILTALFEHNFSDSSFAYRPRRGPKLAVRKSAAWILEHSDHTIVQLDVTGFFDNIRHAGLRERLRRRVRDKRAFRLLNGMLRANFEGIAGANKIGVAQGLTCSGLLANIYLFEFDELLAGYFRSLGGCYLRYSDDITVFVPSQHADVAQRRVTEELKLLGLEVNQKKTFVGSVQNGFDLFGFHLFASNARVHVRVSEPSLERLSSRLKTLNEKHSGEELLSKRTQLITGWAGYYTVNRVTERQLKDMTVSTPASA